MQPGTLYIVGTPIGNLKDISLRAIDTLKNSDYIISEDARQASKLLSVYEISKHQISYRDENKTKAIPKIIDLLKSGANLSLITDSGTPTISDPGFRLVEEVLAEDIKVISIPGPSAVTASLSIAGLPTDKFTFVGFLPRKGKERTSIIREFGAMEATMIIYESPFRIRRTLKDIHEILGDRYIAVVKEISKIHEQTFRGYISDSDTFIPENNIKGEFVILVAKDGFRGKMSYSADFRQKNG